MFKKIILSLTTLLIVVLLSALVALYLAPGIALSYVSDWYAEQGADYKLEVKDWQFAPFSTHLALSGVTLKHPKVGQESTHLDQLVVDINLWALLQQKIEIRNLVLDGVDLALEALLTDTQDSINIAGLIIPLSSDQQKAGNQSDDQSTDVEEDAVKADETTAEANAEDSQITENTEVASVEGRVIETEAKSPDFSEKVTQPEKSAEPQPWAVQVNNLEIKNQNYQWQVRLDDVATQGKVRINKLQLRGLDSSTNSRPQINAEIELQQLSVSGAQNLQLNNPLILKMNGRLNNLLTQPQWQGELSLNDFSFSLEEELILGFSALSLKNIVADASAQTIENFLIQKITLADSKGLTLSIDDLTINEVASGDKQSFASLQLNNIVMNDEPMSLAVEQVSLGNFSHQDLKLQLESLLVKQVSLTSQEQKLLSLQHYGLADLVADFSDKEFAVTLGKQNYSGLLVNIERNKEGQLVGLVANSTASDGEKPDAAVAADDATAANSVKTEDKPLLLALALAGLIQQAEEADSENPVTNKIHVEDYSIKPALKTDINIHKINIGEVNSTIKKSDFSLTNAVPFEINLGIGRYNKITATGQLGLFEREGALYPQGEVILTVHQLDLVPFNGYFIQAMGYQLNRGSLDVDAKITFDKAQLGGEAKLLLRNSKFTPVDEATIKKVSKQISMPIDTAVGLLRDDNGNLRLTIPLSGDLSDPDVGLNDISKQLTQRALKAGTVYFLKQALQPYGTMLTVASFAGDYLFAIRLDSLLYEQDVSDLSDAQIANLTKVAELMKNKKDIEVQACPFVSTQEAQQMGDNWADLARERGQKVKDWLVAYDEKVSERLSICRPQQGKIAEVVLGVN